LVSGAIEMSDELKSHAEAKQECLPQPTTLEKIPKRWHVQMVSKLTQNIAWLALAVAAVSAVGTFLNAIINLNNSQKKLPTLEYHSGTGVVPATGEVSIQCNIKNTSDVAAQDVYIDCATGAKECEVYVAGYEFEKYSTYPTRVLVKIKLIPPHSNCSVNIVPGQFVDASTIHPMDQLGIHRVYTSHTNGTYKPPNPYHFH